MKKTKVFVISDHILAPSGVGTQTKYIIDALYNTGKYQFVCFGGALQHEDYKPQKFDQYGDDLVLYPVKGYGNQEMVRSIIRNEKPDILWFMTDPRFYEWLWDMENEIRPNIPMVYYHVWDNYPFPKFNKSYYLSNDVIACISKVTHDIVRNVTPEVESHYIPHSINTDIFKPLESGIVEQFATDNFPEDYKSKRFTFFWNNRNARRKMSGSVLWWFNDFAEKVGPEKVRLIMHTDPRDPHGQDLPAIIDEIGAGDGRIMLSDVKIEQSGLAMMYNYADCTINISDAEGFGLATLESLACGTPIIVNMTGGLQEQVTDGKEWFGVGIEPASKAVIGSLQVPYIHEDRVSKKDFIDALAQIYEMSTSDREEISLKGRQHVMTNYNFVDYQQRWVDLFDNIIEKYGSWDNRKGYTNWELKEIS